jgi:hypothetical protein
VQQLQELHQHLLQLLPSHRQQHQQLSSKGQGLLLQVQMNQQQQLPMVLLLKLLQKQLPLLRMVLL